MGLGQDEEEFTRLQPNSKGRGISSIGGRESTESLTADETMPLEDSVEKRNSARKSINRSKSNSYNSMNDDNSSSVGRNSKGRTFALGEMSMIEQGGDTPNSIGTIQSAVGRTPSSPRDGARGTINNAYESASDFGRDVGGDGYDDGGDLGWDGDEYADATDFKRSSEKDGDNRNNRRVSFGKGTKRDNLAAKTKTPQSVRSAATTPESGRANSSFSMSTPGSNEFPRGRSIPDESFRDEAEAESDDELLSDTDSEDKSLNLSPQKKTKKRVNRYEDDSLHLSNILPDDEDEETNGLQVRRSKRRFKGVRFAYWKSERVVYHKGEVVGELRADKTPIKYNKRSNNKQNDKKLKFTHTGAFGNNGNEKTEPILLPKDVTYLPRDESNELLIWDESRQITQTARVLCFRDNLNPSTLPITAIRPPGKDKVGVAAQSFNVPEQPGHMSGWISGFVELPAGAIKDAEGVGECSQVFFVANCQDGAVELGIAHPGEAEWDDSMAQRQLLKKGDSFFIPAGNIYRLENHSSTMPCTIYWTIIKPLTGSANMTDDDGEEEETPSEDD